MNIEQAKDLKPGDNVKVFENGKWINLKIVNGIRKDSKPLKRFDGILYYWVKATNGFSNSIWATCRLYK